MYPQWLCSIILKNHYIDIVNDEQVFSSGRVVHVGQPIGIVVADTHEHALHAAQLVQVEYEV